MTLVTHAIAFGLGYALATPEGRARLAGLRDQGAELAQRPEVKQVRERAWDAVGEAGLTARNRLTARRAGSTGAESSSSGSGTPSTGIPPVTPAPAPVAVVPTPGAEVSTSDDLAADPLAGDEDLAGDPVLDGPERLAGTTVAEDTRAVVLGLPEPDPELATPPAKRR